MATFNGQHFHRTQKWLPHQDKGREGRKEGYTEIAVNVIVDLDHEPTLPSCNPCIFVPSSFCTSVLQSSACEAIPNLCLEALEVHFLIQQTPVHSSQVIVSTLDFSYFSSNNPLKRLRFLFHTWLLRLRGMNFQTSIPLRKLNRCAILFLSLVHHHRFDLPSHY